MSKIIYREAKKKDDEVTTKTYTDTPAGPDILNPDDKPIAPSKPEQPKAEPTSPQLKKASQSDTLRATAGITPNERMRDLLSRMRDIDVDPTDAGYPEPEPTTDLTVRVDTENLPVVANKALAAAGTVTPTFHQVANLPGNMSRGIRTMGKQLFRMFTRTPTEDIYMIGNVAGMGPNSGREMNAVAGYLRDKGQNMGVGDLEFDQVIPGYNAEVSQFKANGIRWLLVRDEFGEYVYAWPESDSVMFNDNNRMIGRNR
jgi:hypothetical protein